MTTQRKISVTSEPAGADVYYDYNHQGQTPVEFEFQWFGYHQFTVNKDGYEPVDDTVRIRAPFYLWVPVDLLWEILPVRITYRKRLHYELEEAEVLDIF